jgi:2-polyprenyl-6-methoxyphenol hydroxylase-like FAD-dependent oxidoreductase
MDKKLIIDQSEWSVADEDAVAVAGAVQEAMANRTTIALNLYDKERRPVTVYLNGAAAASVVFDPHGEPRPSQMS